MTDNLFSKIAYHKNNLQKHQTTIAYRNMAFEATAGLDGLLSHQTETSQGKLPPYKYFKTIQLNDILILRAIFDADNETHQFWCSKIHRFLEFRLNSISERLQKNYAKKEERVQFIQNVITLLLEYYVATHDSRYLSTAIKLLRNVSLAKFGFLNTTYSAQYSYNILAVDNLIKKL